MSRNSTSDRAQENRFVEYFLICGLDEEAGLDPYQSGGQQPGILSPLQLSYNASILWHFPEDQCGNPFDRDGIRMLCMPRGVYFTTGLSQEQSKFHTFLQTREDGARFYGCVITFYEEVKNENICIAMETLFKMFAAEKLSMSPTSPPISSSTPAVPSRSAAGARFSDNYCSATNKLYVTKCICLVLQSPFINAAKMLLEKMLEVGLHEEDSDLPLESYVYNTLYEVPSPPPGRTLKIAVDDSVIIVPNPNLNELPYFGYSFKAALMTLGFENLVDLFTCMLLEHQILLLSSDIHKLMLIAECLSILFFPLLWQHVYVPVLPPNLMHMLDAPVPFLMGMYYEMEEEKNRLEFPCEGGLCFLDIDENVIELPSEIPELPGRQHLIEELAEVALKYDISAPKGSLSFRSQLDLTKAGSLEFTTSSDSEYETLGDFSTDSPSGACGTWPRKKRNSLGVSSGLSPRTSPSNSRRSPISGSSPALNKKKFGLGSNWAGQSVPAIHGSNLEPVDGSFDHSTSPVAAVSTPNSRLMAMMAIAEKVGLPPGDILQGKYLKKLGYETPPESRAALKDDLFVLNERAVHVTRRQQHDDEFNIAVREIFANRFAQMLVDYEHFVILPTQSKEEWLNNRDIVQNFDKATFLADQSQLSLPFMTLFVETQGFASLIDMKIMALWENCDPRLEYFDKRVDKVKVKLGIIRTSEYEKCTSVGPAIEAYVKQCNHIDHSAAQPHQLKLWPNREPLNGQFPLPDKDVLLTPASGAKAGKVNWRRREKRDQLSEHILLNESLKTSQVEGQKIREKLAEKVKKYMQESKMIRTDSESGAGGQKTLSAFAEKLLKECKIKTKRLVVLKLGQEAVELGHAGPNSVGTEESTLTASLCDLLERVWSHGVQLRHLEFGKESAKSKFVQRMRQSKSALWAHLTAFYQKESERLAAVYGLTDAANVADDIQKLLVERNKSSPVRKQSTVDALAENLHKVIRSMSPEQDADTSRQRDVRRPNDDGGRSKSLPTTPTTPTTEAQLHQEQMDRVAFLADLKIVMEMKEIKTDTGYARAWTRLALEKKGLARQLKILLSYRKILETRYKEYAFIRTEDEMEQFLYHLLSLNAVNFYCFTNGFANTTILYKVHIVVGRSLGSSTTANTWINVTGTSGSTGKILTPKGDYEFKFKYTNLGLLTALRIGHDNAGLSPGWFVDYVLIANEVTGHAYRFQCGRWLSKSNDDGSIERLLVAEMLNERRTQKHASGVLRLGISDEPPEPSSPVLQRKTSLFSKKATASDIQEKVADAVNNIVKFLYQTGERSLTYLVCGENGFYQALELVFQHGFKSTRLFGKNLFVWDYIERVYQNHSADQNEDLQTDSEHRRWKVLCSVVDNINTLSHSIGKDQKLQLLVCLGLRDHHLQDWFRLFSDSPVTALMYEPCSFLRDANHLNFLMDVLESLTEFNIVLDKSVTRGL